MRLALGGERGIGDSPTASVPATGLEATAGQSPDTAEVPSSWHFPPWGYSSDPTQGGRNPSGSGSESGCDPKMQRLVGSDEYPAPSFLGQARRLAHHLRQLATRRTGRWSWCWGPSVADRHPSAGRPGQTPEHRTSLRSTHPMLAAGPQVTSERSVDGGLVCGRSPRRSARFAKVAAHPLQARPAAPCGLPRGSHASLSDAAGIRLLSRRLTPTPPIHESHRTSPFPTFRPRNGHQRARAVLDGQQDPIRRKGGIRA